MLQAKFISSVTPFPLTLDPSAFVPAVFAHELLLAPLRVVNIEEIHPVKYRNFIRLIANLSLANRSNEISSVYCF